jgi:hypothetical protein
MPKIIDIKILYSKMEDRNQLEKEILQKIKEGWEIKGDIMISNYSSYSIVFAATMVKYEVTATVDLLGN